MAQLAGMTLRERWSGWNREPFTNDSRQRVSVWEMRESLNVAVVLRIGPRCGATVTRA